MRVEVPLPLKRQHLEAFTARALDQLATDAPGRPVVINMDGKSSFHEPHLERIGTVVDAWTEGDHVLATLDVEIPEALRPGYEEGKYAFGINGAVRKTEDGGTLAIRDFIRLDSVDLVPA